MEEGCDCEANGKKIGYKALDQTEADVGEEGSNQYNKFK